MKSVFVEKIYKLCLLSCFIGIILQVSCNKEAGKHVENAPHILNKTEIIGKNDALLSMEKDKKKLLENNPIDKESEFKIWLKDTLNVIQNRKSDLLNSEINIEKDSLSFELKKSYKLTLNKSYNGNEKEIIYALSLLETNNLMPKNQFNLDFTILYFYYVSSVELLKYDFDSEIQKFIVACNNERIEYQFVKGNLIGSEKIL